MNLIDELLHDGAEHLGDGTDLAAMTYAGGAHRANAIAREWERARRRQEQIEIAYQDELARLNAWRDDNTKTITTRIEWYEQQLVGWHRHLIETGECGKTLTLPRVTLRARQQPARIEFDAPDEALAWCRANAPDLVRNVETLDKPAANKRLQATDNGVIDPTTGEIVPGAITRPSELRISVTMTEAKQ